MASFHILVVEDQSDVRRMLRSGLESLGSDFLIADVPSGEEAMLVSSRQPIDVLVTDVRLAGISGLELMHKIKTSNPFLKVIIITGLTDPEIRQKVSQAGAEACFFKPVDIDELLDAVERVLGRRQAIFGTSHLQHEILPLLSERISRFQQEINSICVVLLDENGQEISRAGDLPETTSLFALLPDLMSALNASLRVTYALGKDVPKDILFFQGAKIDIYMAHVDKSVTLLIVTDNDISESAKTAVILNLPDAIDDLNNLLAGAGKPQEIIETKTMGHEPEAETSEEEDISDLNGIFDNDATKKFIPKELESFWDKAADQDSIGEIPGSDSMTYDQARQLGIAPENEP